MSFRGSDGRTSPRPGHKASASALERRALEPIERTGTIADEVVDRIVLAIVRGEKKPGERITEAEIAVATDISRVPVREAMQKLASQGVLVPSDSRRGLQVAAFGKQRIGDLYEIRLEIEKITFRHAQRRCRMDPTLLKELEGIIDEMVAHVDDGDHVRMTALDVAFHKAVARISGNDLARQIFDGLAQQLFIVCCGEWIVARNPGEEIELHRRLYTLLSTGTPEDIEPTIVDHIYAPHSPVTHRPPD